MLHCLSIQLLMKSLMALIGGVLFYSLWLAALLLVRPTEGSILRSIAWMVAPLLTSLGFTVAVFLVERRTSLWRIYPWPLIGCILGSGVAYRFGPMLIVFGMLLAGTASVVLRELLTRRAI